MHRRSASALALCALMAAFPSLASALDAFDFSSPREKSMGGRHVALADDFSVLLSNPAGLADVSRVFSAADLGVQAIGPVFDIANLFVGGMPGTAAITDFLAAKDYKLYAGAEITGPLAFGYTGGGLGFGLFNKSKLTVNVANVSSIGIKAVEDLLLSGGYAMRLDLGKGHELSAGVSAKGFVRGGISPTMGIVEALGLKDNPMALLAETFTISTGIGLDAGLRWAWNGRVAAGLACRDIYSPVIVSTYSSAAKFVADPTTAKKGESTYETLKRSLDFGLMWAPSLGRLGQVIDSLVLVMDYKDILDLASPLPRNPILNLSLGFETRVLEIVTLRGGIDETLLSAGAGLDLGIFTLNIAAYGAELGLDPGDRPYYNLLMDFDFKY
jgi:hypothetical protein